MTGETIQIATNGGSFDCYLALPAEPGPAIAMAPSAFGVNEDLKKLCDDFAAKGYAVAAPDIFWRGDKGALAMDEDGRKRALARIAGAAIQADTKQALGAALAELRGHAKCNGKSAVLGFCFGGPFAVVGVTELGCDAGASYHGGGFDRQLDNLKTAANPLQLHWGDDDFALSPELLDQVRAASAGNANVEIFVYPGGVKHGYTMPSAPVYDAPAATLSWQRTMPMLEKLKGPAARAAE